MSDRLKEMIERLVEAIIGPRLDRCALYPARVVAQSAADGTLEVQLDDKRFPSMTKVPLRTPVPGAVVKVAAGARVLIGWEATEEARGPDPRRPYASLWESGELSELQIAGTDPVSLSSKVDAVIEAFVTATPVSNDGGAALQTAVKAVWEASPINRSTAASKLKTS